MSSYTIIAPKAAKVAETFRDDLASAPHWLWQQGLLGPLDGFLNRTGKRIRAELIEQSFSLAGGQGDVPQQLVEFIELMHAGSLIIDDIEDGSESRRGQPSLHRTVGVPIALNTGNWMYFSALEKLTSLPVSAEASSQIMSQAISTIRCCHEGQAIDLAARINELEQSEVLPTVSTIARLKTGGLTALAAQLGAAVAGASVSTCEIFSAFGMQLGIGLQMQNDLTELQSCRQPGGRSDDLRNARATWPWAWLSTLQSPQEFCRLQDLLADDSVSDQKLAESLFQAISDFGQLAVRTQLRKAAAILEQEFEAGSLAEFHRVLSKLENRYA